jgi:predicted phosphodiesterase
VTSIGSRTTHKLLVFGGPYSNLRATEALRSKAAELGIAPSEVICTGDVVAYCAEPEETINAIRAWGCHVIAGNCEEQLAEGAGDCGCGFEEGTACDLLAKGWYPFADQRVSEASRAWMRVLPATLAFEFAGVGFQVVHGGIDVINQFIFTSDSATLSEELAKTKADVVIAGHAGLPFIANHGRKVWFNPGVIGMPADDGTAGVWYGLIEAVDGGARLSTHGLAYDARAAAAAMRRWAYADGYAKSLVTGIWPSHDILPAQERANTGKRIRARSLTVAPASAVAAVS